MIKNPYPYIVLILFFGFFSPSTAYAYLDPGTGSMLLQGIIALVAGFLFFVKIYWRKLIGLFTKKKKTDIINPKKASMHE